MNFEPRRPQQKFNIGDRVLIPHAGQGSMSLYHHALMDKMPFVKCPCGAKPTSVFIVISSYRNGYVLQAEADGVKTVCISSDLKRHIVHSTNS